MIGAWLLSIPLLLGMPAALGAGQPWQGHEVSAEPVGGAVHINGMGLSVWRVTGDGLLPLVDALARDWRTADGFRDLASGRWRILARRHEGQAEVLQFDAGSSEALFSRLDPVRFPRRSVTPALLPSGCTPGGIVEDRKASTAMLQVSARCSGTPAAVAVRLRARARQQGHAERGPAGEEPLVFTRRRSETRVFLEAVPGGTALVLLQWTP
jgi:hypothetical protein